MKRAQIFGDTASICIERRSATERFDRALRLGPIGSNATPRPRTSALDARAHQQLRARMPLRWRQQGS